MGRRDLIDASDSRLRQVKEVEADKLVLGFNCESRTGILKRMSLAAEV